MLFGSTVLIPQMLQSLYGYTATDAGLVLGPGAFVIVLMTPIVVRLVRRIPAQRADCIRLRRARPRDVVLRELQPRDDLRARGHGAGACRASGSAFLFVPISQLAYSYLPANKNNKASSLTNLFRNLGGSVGIAFVTTMLERRSQFHQTVLVTHVSGSDPAVQLTLAGAAERLAAFGYTTADAILRAPAQIGAIVHQQASLLGILDCFWLLGLLAMIGPVLTLGIRSFGQRTPAGGAH